MKALVGLKKEMTQIFQENGVVVPVTIIDIKNVYVAAKKTKDKDGYDAVLVGYGKKKNATKAETGKFKQLGFVPAVSKEAKMTTDFDLGAELKANTFAVNDVVSITGNTKGKGFQGVVKRWGFAGGPKTHGQSDRHRAPGSIGQRTTPGRVYKGKKMAGRMGGIIKTVKNLVVVAIDEENGLIAVRGAVPGNKGSLVFIKSVK